MTAVDCPNTMRLKSHLSLLPNTQPVIVIQKSVALDDVQVLRKHSRSRFLFLLILPDNGKRDLSFKRRLHKSRLKTYYNTSSVDLMI